MKDQTKTKTNKTPIQESASLRRRIKKLERSKAAWEKEKEALKKSEARFRSYFEMPLYGVAITSPEKGWIQVNDRLCSIMGYSRDELSRLTWAEMTYPDDLAADVEQFERVLSGRIEQYDLDKRFIRKDGKVVWANLSAGCVRKPDGRVDYMVVMVEDITGVKLAEQALRDTETRYRLLFEHAPDGILIIDPATARPLEFNETAHRQLGYSREEFSGMSIFDLEAVETPEETRSRIEQVMREGRADFETRQRTRQGEVRDVHVSAQITEILGRSVYHCVWRDITDRKRAEEALTNSEEKFRKAFYTSPDSVNINRLEDGKYVSINPGFTRITGYTEEDIVGKTSIEYNIWANSEDRQRLTAGLKKDRQVVNLEAAFRTKKGEIRHGLMSASLIDLHGVPHILSITRDITDRRRAEEELRRTLESLRHAVGATIQVMVTAVEIRDPYTAGHQFRSADLARAIAQEMGLPQEKIDGIRMAGSIHDIGKLSIPAEILSKPTKLTALEFSLIKEHSQKGYEMLKDVESPWPLAQIVYQHHERMNGSGYPRSLKGNEILMEARILAVSDVVESMASHRPYRPALGIPEALEEIDKNRGILYDISVVDACQRLFHEKGYQLPVPTP